MNTLQAMVIRRACCVHQNRALVLQMVVAKSAKRVEFVSHDHICNGILCSRVPSKLFGPKRLTGSW